MKRTFVKKLCIFISCLGLTFSLYAQSNNTVDIADDIYSFLRIAETRGLCDSLSPVRPYTEKYIVSKLDQILENLDDENQKAIVEEYKNKYKREDGLSLKELAYKMTEQKGDVPVSLAVDLYNDTFMSGGMYSNSSNNSFGYEIENYLNVFGDLGNNISYRSLTYLEVTKMNIKKLGEYNIGWWWYDDYGDKDSFVREDHFNERTINTYRNYAVLPYSYKKHWDGSVYYLHGGMNSAGLTGWPFETSCGFGMQGEIHGTFFNDLFSVGIGRYNREWGAMDTGSSLVLNQNAHPFFGVDTTVNLFKWLNFSALTGFLEFPNQNYINENAWYPRDDAGNKIEDIKDSFFFHNLFSMAEFNFDFTNVHFDFGSTVVYPNRFELGYSFPLVDRVVYQNNVGDYDNLALFANLKGMLPGIGSIWGSVYIDEINALKTDALHNTRCMFAYQAGSKVNIPWLPFTVLSLRYSKIEPYCYTHEALDPEKNQPYYSHYICENYTNNGESLGYYLQPNSDEIFVKLETQPLPAASFSLQYQLIRHGVDWGSESNIYSGSSIYSELPAGRYGPGRNNLHKYFLKDGVYEWMNILALQASYDCKHFGIPLQFYGTVGYVHNWFTSIGSATPSKNAKYSKYSSDEYKEDRGVVLSLGIKACLY